MRLTTDRVTAHKAPATRTVEVTDMLHTEHLMDQPPAMAEMVGGLLTDEASTDGVVAAEMAAEGHWEPADHHPMADPSLVLAALEAETEE